jgi:hypothetical protein
MKPTIRYTVFVLLLLSFTACKQSTDETQGNATLAEVEEAAKPIYDPAKGCHIVGSEMTKMLVDTLGIVMYEFIMKPGDSVGWHPSIPFICWKAAHWPCTTKTWNDRFLKFLPT